MNEKKKPPKQTFPICHCRMLVLALERATEGHDSLPLSNGTWKHPDKTRQEKNMMDKRKQSTGVRWVAHSI